MKENRYGFLVQNRQRMGLNEAVPTRARELRLEKAKTTPSAFTLAEVARRAGVSITTLVTWEAGTATPHKRNQRALAKALGVNVEDLGFGTRAPAPRTTQLKPLAAGIVLRGDRVLLTERRFPGHGEQWSWPSGKIEEGESLDEALLRELNEELLLTEATIVGHVGDVDLPSGYRMSHFLVTIPDDAEPKLNDYEQLAQVRWMSRAEAARAFKSLPPDIARKALEFLDRVLAGDGARPSVSSA